MAAGQQDPHTATGPVDVFRAVQSAACRDRCSTGAAALTTPAIDGECMDCVASAQGGAVKAVEANARTRPGCPHSTEPTSLAALSVDFFDCSTRSGHSVVARTANCMPSTFGTTNCSTTSANRIERC